MFKIGQQRIKRLGLLDIFFINLRFIESYILSCEEVN